MAYNSIITQQGSTGIPPAVPSAAPLVPLEYAHEIIGLMPAKSAALQLMRKINMGHTVLQVPVLDTLPQAYWVGNQGIAGPGTPGTGYPGLKQTTQMAWKGVQLTAQELAVIVPIPDNLMADAMFPIWSEVVPMVAGALAQALDAAVLFGYNSPFAAPGIVQSAVAAGNSTVLGTASAATGGYANDIAQAFSQVEYNSGFEVNGVIANKSLRVLVRNARTTFGQQLEEINVNQWYDQEVVYGAKGLWPVTAPTGQIASTTSGSNIITLTTGTTATLSVGDLVSGAGIPAGSTVSSITDSTHFVINNNATATATGVALTERAPAAVLGDMTQAIIGERQDIAFEMFNEGIIQDNAGNIVLNLMQQDAHALRVTARYGYAVANSVTYFNAVDNNRFPFAALLV